MEEKQMEVVPGLAGIPAAESAISYVDGEKGILEYRGIPAETLAEKSTFLEVAYLLLFGKLPSESEYNKFKTDITYHTRLKIKIQRMMEFLPENGHPMEYLQSVVAAMGMYYPAKDVFNEESRYWSVVRLIAKMPTIVAACERLKSGDAPIQPNNELSFAANFYYMLFEKTPDSFTEKILDAMFILHADHTMNASTFSGPLHGGANEEVVHMLKEIGTKENARPYIEKMIEKHEKIMGVGHRVYKTKDPRATFLQGYAHRLFKNKTGKSNLLEIAEEVEKIVNEKLDSKKLYPNVDFYSGIVLQEIGIPTDLFTHIFAMGRVAGWLSHWLEQLKTNKIYRPDQKYTGLRNQEYVPMSKRR